MQMVLQFETHAECTIAVVAVLLFFFKYFYYTASVLHLNKNKTDYVEVAGGGVVALHEMMN